MSDPKVARYMLEVIATFTVGRANIEDAMRLITRELKGSLETQQIQLLALRRYVRLGGARIVQQWPWTPAEAQQHTKETKDLLAEATEVAKVFAADNPGLQLVISQLRDLERQVHLWCTNSSIHTAARGLIVDAKTKLANAMFLPTPTATAVEAFRNYLHQVIVTPEPTSAVPGTSDHGQQHAVDFVVMKGGTVIAGVDTAKIGPDWKSTGLEKKLHAATEKTPQALVFKKPVLKGPLTRPYEPWHYSLPRGH